jgi:hypothetical protein
MSRNTKHIQSSDASEDSEADVIQTPDCEGKTDTSTLKATVSHRFREKPQKTCDDHNREKNSDDSIAVMVPAPKRPWEYQPFRGDTTVDAVLEVKTMGGKDWYTIEYENGRRELVSFFSYYFPAQVLLFYFPHWRILLFWSSQKFQVYMK